MKQIELIELNVHDKIHVTSHPRQAELYDDTIDANFVESIKLHGIKQMPVVAKYTDIADGFEERPFTKSSDDDIYVIISGHRRIAAALKAGITSITAELKHYENYFDSEVDHIIYNKQRVKTKKEIASELIAYKQKLDQIRKELQENGLKGIEKYKSFNVSHHVKTDSDGKYYLPFATDMIEKDLGISKKHQEQLNVIFSENWLQDKVEIISASSLSAKKKEKAINDFSKVVEDARNEVDKKDGLSINKVHTEIIRIWNDIDSIINPKPKQKPKKVTKTKKVVKEEPIMIAHKAESICGFEPDATVEGEDYSFIMLNGLLYYTLDKNECTAENTIYYLVNTDIVSKQIKDTIK